MFVMDCPSSDSKPSDKQPGKEISQNQELSMEEPAEICKDSLKAIPTPPMYKTIIKNYRKILKISICYSERTWL